MIIDAEAMKKFSRFAVEEMMRRQAKKGQPPFSKKQILDLLVPDHVNIVNQYKSDVQAR